MSESIITPSAEDIAIYEAVNRLRHDGGLIPWAKVRAETGLSFSRWNLKRRYEATSVYFEHFAAAPYHLKYLCYWLKSDGPSNWPQKYNDWLGEQKEAYRATLNKEPGVSLTLEERSGFDDWMKARIK